MSYLLPAAARCIGQGMPAFRHTRIVFHLAAFRKHIGVYAPMTRDAALIRELAPYRNEKGNLSLPLDKPCRSNLSGVPRSLVSGVRGSLGRGLQGRNATRPARGNTQPALLLGVRSGERALR